MIGKACQCGHDMVITLEEVSFGGQVTIKNVPIFHCAVCDHNEVVTGVKEEMKTLIKDLEEQTDKKVVYFNEKSELAHVLETMDRESQPVEMMKEALQNRVNELLDMLILANSLQDDNWKKELNRKLSEVVYT